MLGEHSCHANGYALVLSIHRDDLVAAGLSEKQAASISDEQLIHIGDKLGDALLDCSYWECLGGVLEYFKIKKEGE